MEGGERYGGRGEGSRGGRGSEGGGMEWWKLRGRGGESSGEGTGPCH